MDNAACHLGRKSRELIDAAGARLLFLPPYSPDFSPIEFAWRNVRAALREAGGRTAEALLSAIEAAMQAVTAQDAATMPTAATSPWSKVTEKRYSRCR